MLTFYRSYRSCDFQHRARRQVRRRRSTGLHLRYGGLAIALHREVFTFEPEAPHTL
jgi:hypothetical protein